ncbi:MAG: ribokinase [Chloroflexota bacterium]
MTCAIVVVGGINMDLTVWVDHLPQPGETVRGDRILRHPGGKGANQAVAAARAGASVALIGRVGQDAFGDELLAGFQTDHVDHSGVTRDSEALTGVALIGVDAAGRNTVTVGTGANGRVTRDDLDHSAELIRSANIGVLNFEIPMDVVLEAARRFHASGASVVLNLSPLFTPPEDLLPLVDVLIVNEVEGAAVAGELSDPSSTVQRIHDCGVPMVVLTLGAAGVVLNAGDEIFSVPGYPVDVIDPTAAGDAFLGTFVAELASATSMLEACRRANCAGALAVTRAGAQPSIPTRAEVDEFIRDRGLSHA